MVQLRRLLRIALGAVLWAASLCRAGAGDPAAAAAPAVVATVVPVHSLVAAVMDGVGTPYLLIRGATSPHQAVLRPSDARALGDAAVVFWVGPGLETALERAIGAIAGRARVVTLAAAPGMLLLPIRAGGLWEPHGEAAPDDHERPAAGAGNVNPHLWLDPENAKRIAALAARVLAETDPAHAARYRDNAARLAVRLDALDRSLAARLAPVRGVPFLVFHDAYAYLEARYGLTGVGALHLHAGVAPGARRLAELRRGILEKGVACVFAEPQFVPALVETIIEGTPARAGILDPVGYGLAPGPDAYFALMERLADNLVACLKPG